MFAVDRKDRRVTEVTLKELVVVPSVQDPRSASCSVLKMEK